MCKLLENNINYILGFQLKAWVFGSDGSLTWYQSLDDQAVNKFESHHHYLFDKN
jgi:hypothetical protein